MTQSVITYELTEGIAVIGLNRSDKRNAMNGDVFEQLSDAVDRAQQEANVGVIFGHGENFSAGLDLKYAATELLAHDPIRPDKRRSNRGFDLVARGGIPFVSALHGAVIGAGFELAAATHIRIADETAFFALPESQRGIFVGGGGSVRIQRLIGYSHMADMMLMGRVFNAREAERIGAIQYLVPEGEKVMDRAMAAAKRIAANAPRSNWAIVNALPRIADLPDDEGLFVETLTARFVSASADSKERIADFLEKRARPLK